MKVTFYIVVSVWLLLGTAALYAQEEKLVTYQNRTQAQNLVQNLGRLFPELAQDLALQNEYEEQLRFMFLKGYTFQEVFAQCHQELTLRFALKEQNGKDTGRTMEALRNLNNVKSERIILTGPEIRNGSGFVIAGNNPFQKSGKPHR